MQYDSNERGLQISYAVRYFSAGLEYGRRRCQGRKIKHAGVTIQDVSLSACVFGFVFVTIVVFK